MNRGSWWKATLIVISILLAIVVLYPPGENLNLGLDLKGGIYLVYRIDTTKLPSDLNEREAVTRALKIIRNRVDHLGVNQPEIQRTQENRIIVSLPGVTNSKRAKRIIGKTAQLKFHLVREKQREITEQGLAEAYRLASCSDNLSKRECPKRNIVIERKAALTGRALQTASVRFLKQGPAVSLSFTEKGGRQFGDLTSEHVDDRIAILLDGKVISAPEVNEAIYGGQAQITGRFTDQEAADLALMIRAGALPAPLEQVGERSVGPSLGEDSIRSGLYASIGALILVMVFMALYYQFAGLVADLTLIFCLLFLMAGLAGLGATLTLPGIAGIVLTIGMAVDANVIIFERIKEELQDHTSVVSGYLEGFRRSTPAILDAQVTTAITAFALYFFGTGPVKGYAVTLILGLIASLWSAIFIGKYLFSLGTSRSEVDMLHIGWRLPIGTLFDDLLRYSRWALAFSAIVLAIGTVSVMNHGGLVYGIDFTGGLRTILKFPRPITASDLDTARSTLSTITDSSRLKTTSVTGEEKRRGLMVTARTDVVVNGLTDRLIRLAEKKGDLEFEKITQAPSFQWINKELLKRNFGKGVGGNDRIDLKTASRQTIHHRAQTIVNENLSGQMVRMLAEALKKDTEGDPVSASNGSFKLVKSELVSPAIGADLIWYSCLALGVSFIGILLYLSYRFEWKYSIAAIAAIIHDVLIAAGLLTVLEVEFDVAVVAAVLTVIGYSINDTIVNFDRIRENRMKMGSTSDWYDVINRSVQEVLSRTIITSLTTFFAVLILYLYGGIALEGFSLALIIGVVFGTFSSIFIANYLLYRLQISGSFN